MTTPYEPEGLLGILVAHEVDFVVIGGVAVVAQGYVRATRDLDICCDRQLSNLDKLAEALRDVGARLRGAEDVELPLDGRFLRSMQIATFATSLGSFDCLADPDGAPAYAAMKERASRVDIGSHTVLVASIDDLLSMKRAAGRPRDLQDIEALEVIQRLQAEGQPEV